MGHTPDQTRGKLTLVCKDMLFTDTEPSSQSGNSDVGAVFLVN